MRKLYLLIFLISAQIAAAQETFLPGLCGTNNSATAGNVGLDWAIGTIVPLGLSPFPVRLVSFEGKLGADGDAVLSWKTAEEISNQGFEVQKSTDGISFVKIGWLDGKNGDVEQHYTFTDNALTETSYYRLKQIDFDGAFTWSHVIVVIPENERIALANAYPNPTENGNVTISLPDQTRELNLSDLLGRPIQKIVLPQNTTNIRLPASGLFILDIRTKTEHKSIKLIRK